MKSFYVTDRGQVRKHNEDAGGVFLNQTGQSLAVVADGMGGHLAGDVASSLAIQSLENGWQEVGRIESPIQSEQLLLKSLSKANEKVYTYSLEKEQCRGMGTTIVAAICTESFITVAHIGDSRCYLLNEFGFKQITQDHSLVNELIKSGEITKNAAEYHPQKNVLMRALGTEDNVEADCSTINWDPSDKILLCSDGLTNKISDQELENILLKDASLHTIGEEMIELANIRGGEDNISLTLVEYDCKVDEGMNEC